MHRAINDNAASIPPDDWDIAIELQDPKEEKVLIINDQPSAEHFKSVESSVRVITSPREEWIIAQEKDATDGLFSLYIICVLLILTCIGLLSTFSGYIYNIFIDMNFDGTYEWNIGWSDAQFSYLNNAAPSQTPFYQNYEIEEIQQLFPIPNSLIYMKNAGYLLASTSIIIFIFTICILYILCYRSNTNHPLYLKCICCRIPHRPSIYFLFDIIELFIWITATYYIMLMIYSLFETYFYLSIDNKCPPGNTCWSYIIPHYAFFLQLIILFSITFCSFRKVKNLDIKFNTNNLKYYFPKNIEKSEIHNNISLESLFCVISSLKYIIILSLIMIISFRDCGLISIWFHNTSVNELNVNGLDVVSVYFQFQGLINDHGITENEFIKNINTNSSDQFVMSYNESEINGFKTISITFYYFLCLLLLINLFIILPYIWIVIHKYNSINCCKYTLICIGCMELVCFTMLFVLYYVEYYKFFKETAQSDLENDLQTFTEDSYDIQWFPDWGVILCILLGYYMLRFVYYVFKAL